MTEEKQRLARCLCGQLRVTVKGDPIRVYGCSCFECQRRTGSTFTYTAQFEAASASIEGEYRTFKRLSDKGLEVETTFCPNCGSTMFNKRESMPGLIGVAVGTFNDPSFQPPKLIAWASRRHAWLVLPDGVGSLETQ